MGKYVEGEDNKYPCEKCGSPAKFYQSGFMDFVICTNRECRGSRWFSQMGDSGFDQSLKPEHWDIVMSKGFPERGLFKEVDE